MNLNNRLVGLVVISLVCANLLLAQQAADPPPEVRSPIAPEQALDQFELAPGLRIEVVVAEPEVIDPVAIRFDEDGRMWVVEMRDYPHGPAKGKDPQSTIKILEDRDEDGRFETATVFADKLLFATGVQPWKGGVFVTMAGQVAYMKDTDGDGKTDLRETWFTGFAQENSQLRANHPRLGLDNHIYVANGLRGGAVVDARKPGSKPLSISGMDFRFDPLTRKFEAVSGVGQFGLTFDDWGNRFVCSNRNPVKHIVLENRYLKKNPLAKIPAVAHDVAKSGADSRIFPIANAWTTSNLHAGQFTAACGVHIYRGDALPKEFYGNVFTCDPTGYLVHREIMKPSGATFVSQPARKGVEFLASRDEWFRPVNLETGPDGALYVVDMYRAVIEHPQFVPTELKERRDLLFGNDRGRIYRIVAKDAPARRPPHFLSKGKDVELVKLLGHTNAWQRETAARLLLERQNRSIEKQLEKLALSAESPTAQVHALCLLDGLEVLEEGILLQALDSQHPRVCEQVIRLSEPLLKTEKRLLEKMEKVAINDDRLVFQTILSRARNRDDATSAHWALVDAEEHPGDVWIQRAALIGIGPLAHEVVSEYDPGSVDGDHEVGFLRELVGLAAATPNPTGHRHVLETMIWGSDRISRVGFVALVSRIPLERLVKNLDERSRGQLRRFFDNCAKVARDPKESLHQRLEAIEALAFSKSHTQILEDLVRQGRFQQIRIAAANGLARHGDLEFWQELATRFRSESPAVRSAILNGLLAHSDRTALLLDSIESGHIKPSEIDRSRTNRLLKHGSAEIRKRAQQLFADAIPADRRKVLADYQAVLKMKSDSLRGQVVFKRNCANCHRIGDLGVNVAPDISDSRTKQPAQILTDILQPNRAIDANYISYSVVDTAGRVLVGILTSETATSVTLKQAEGKEVTLLRGEIEQIRSSGQSLMPVGLEKDINHQQMADLISFIKNWRYLDGRIPLNRQ